MAILYGNIIHCRFCGAIGGQNEEDVCSEVYFLNQKDDSWQRRDDMVAGVTETSIHSAYAVINIKIDED